MSVCPLLDPFKKYLKMSIFIGLNMCTPTANTSVGNQNLILGYFQGNLWAVF